MSELRMTDVLKDFRAGNRDAFAAVIKRYEPQLLGWIKRRLGRARSGLKQSDDVAQSVFFRLSREIESNRTWIQDMSHTDDLERVLFRIASWRVVDAIRRETRECRRDTVSDQNVAAGPDDAPLIESLPDPKADPVAEGDLDIMMAEMRDRVAAVRPQWVPVLRERLRGASNPEIARAVGMPLRSVELAVRGIKNILREWEHRIGEGVEGAE